MSYFPGSMLYRTRCGSIFEAVQWTGTQEQADEIIRGGHHGYVMRFENGVLDVQTYVGHVTPKVGDWLINSRTFGTNVVDDATFKESFVSAE